MTPQGGPGSADGAITARPARLVKVRADPRRPVAELAQEDQAEDRRRIGRLDPDRVERSSARASSPSRSSLMASSAICPGSSRDESRKVRRTGERRVGAPAIAFARVASRAGSSAGRTTRTAGTSLSPALANPARSGSPSPLHPAGAKVREIRRRENAARTIRVSVSPGSASSAGPGSGGRARPAHSRAAGDRSSPVGTASDPVRGPVSRAGRGSRRLSHARDTRSHWLGPVELARRVDRLAAVIAAVRARGPRRGAGRPRGWDSRQCTGQDRARRQRRSAR